VVEKPKSTKFDIFTYMSEDHQWSANVQTDDIVYQRLPFTVTGFSGFYDLTAPPKKKKLAWPRFLESAVSIWVIFFGGFGQTCGTFWDTGRRN
jgi:hypothetical protein